MSWERNCVDFIQVVRSTRTSPSSDLAYCAEPGWDSSEFFVVIPSIQAVLMKFLKKRGKKMLVITLNKNGKPVLDTPFQKWPVESFYIAGILPTYVIFVYESNKNDPIRINGNEIENERVELTSPREWKLPIEIEVHIRGTRKRRRRILEYAFRSEYLILRKVPQKRSSWENNDDRKVCDNHNTGARPGRRQPRKVMPGIIPF